MPCYIATGDHMRQIKTFFARKRIRKRKVEGHRRRSRGRGIAQAEAQVEAEEGNWPRSQLALVCANYGTQKLDQANGRKMGTPVQIGQGF